MTNFPAETILCLDFFE